MVNLPLVSVITPCYNDGNYLLDCIQSVENSDYKNIEHIIVNDGSKDIRTIKILKTLTGSNKQIIFNISNSGVCNARNFGVKQSKGKYILFLDGDDKISENYIRLAVDALEERKERKVVACNYAFFGHSNKIVILEKFSLERLMGGNIFTITSMIRRDDFLRIGGFNENMKEGLEDWDFWLSLLKDGGEVYYLKNIHFYYRKKSSNSRNFSMKSDDFIILRKKVYENHKQLYQTHFFPIVYSFEYLMISQSLEYRIGRLILKPIRRILKIICK